MCYFVTFYIYIRVSIARDSERYLFQLKFIIHIIIMQVKYEYQSGILTGST